MRPAAIQWSMASSRLPINTQKRNSAPRCTKQRVSASTSPFTQPASRVRSTRHARASPPIDHADQLSDETMRLMKERHIFAVPTFAISEYFAEHAATPQEASRRRRDASSITHASSANSSLPVFRSPWVPMSGPFPHGTQAREFVLMVKYGMTPLAAIQAGTLNGAQAARLEKPDRRFEVRLFRRRNRCQRQSARRHQRARKSHVRDEGRRSGPPLVAGCACTAISSAGSAGGGCWASP